MPSEVILVVEDESIVAADIQGILEGLGYRVVGPVASGEEALARFDAEPADLVLTDIRLPGAMDGIEAAALLRDRFDVPVLYLTAYADRETLRRAGATAPFSYLVKPFRAQELHAAVEMAFHRHRIEVALRHAKADLERRVAEQTADLLETNERLRREIAERRQAEQEGREARARLEHLLAAGPAVIYTAQVGGARGATFVSSNVAAQLGYQPEDFTRDPGFWADRVHPEDRERVLSGLADRVARSGGYAHEYRFRAKDGGYRWMYDEARLTSDESGAPQLVGHWLDVTQRRQAEDALRESEGRAAASSRLLSSVLDHTDTMVAYLDPRFDFLWVNRAYADACKHPPSFFPGKNHFALYPHAENQAIFERVVGTGEPFFVKAKPFEYPDQPERGVTYWDWSLIPTTDAGGRVDGLVLTLAEVTERVRADKALRESEEGHRTILETALDGFWLADTEGRLLEVNESYCRASGYTAQELLAMRIPDLEAAETGDETRAHMREILRRGEDRFESRHRRKDGSLFDVEVCVQYRPTNGGRFVAFLRDVTERRLREQEIRRLNEELDARVAERTAQLADSEARLRAVVTTVPEAVVTSDSQGAITSFNPAAERTFGYAAAEILGRNLSLLMPSPQREEHDGYLQRYLRTGETSFIGQVHEAQGQRKDGTVFPLEVWIEEMAHGAERSFVGMLRDVTERKLAQETLQRSEERFRRVVEHIQDALIVDDVAGRIVFANQRFADLLGYGMERALQLTLEDYVAPEWRATLRDRHDRRVRGERVPDHFEYEALRADGERLWLEVSVVPVIGASGSVTGTQSALRDVTERKRSEEAIRTAVDEWHRTFDSVDVSLVLTSGDGRILRLNRKARRLSARDDPDLLGSAIRDLPPTALWRSAQELALRPTEGETPRAARIRDEESGRTWEVRVSEIAEPDPRSPRRLIFAATDVTDAARLAEELRRHQTMAAIGSLASSVAHEVRGPLFAVSANLDALEIAADPALMECLQPLRRSAARLNALMEDLLDFARPSTGSLAREPLAKVIREAREDCLAAAHSAAVTIAIDPEPAPGHVRMDGARLRQVFVNVVQNAVQHSPREGSVRIEVESAREDGREWLRCRVIDQGPGFRAEDLERVFEPFYSRRKGGTGLGLAIAKRIVEAHGGRIDVCNRPGGGACVCVALPAADE